MNLPQVPNVRESQEYQKGGNGGELRLSQVLKRHLIANNTTARNKSSVTQEQGFIEIRDEYNMQADRTTESSVNESKRQGSGLRNEARLLQTLDHSVVNQILNNDNHYRMQNIGSPYQKRGVNKPGV